MQPSKRQRRNSGELSDDAIFIQDNDGRFLDVSEGAVRMYGYSKDAMIGQTLEMLAAPERNDMEFTFNQRIPRRLRRGLILVVLFKEILVVKPQNWLNTSLLCCEDSQF